jgi:hypothetical protein
VPRLRATIHYAVRRFIVEAGLLGSSLALRVENHDVTVIFPLAGRDDETAKASPGPAFNDRFPPREEIPLIEGARDLHVTTATRAVGEGPKLEDVDILRVEVFIDKATFGASDFTGGSAPQEIWRQLQGEVERAGLVADAAIDRLLAWTRVRHRQAWLGLYGEPVRRIGSDEVVDLDATRRLPWPAQLDMAFNVVERETPLNAERINALRELVEANSSPELPELLLADAQFIASSAEPPDPSRALLIAAVACEVKIKAFLRTSATAEQAPLMELLLSNPRDWSLAAAALFDKPLKIVASRSLKEEQGLWKRIRKLFEQRNALAHRGKVPTEDEAKEGISASRDVFAWLESLSTPA